MDIKKSNNYIFSPGLPGYGIQGLPGKDGDDGKSVYFYNSVIVNTDSGKTVIEDYLNNSISFYNVDLTQTYNLYDLVIDKAGNVFYVYNKVTEDGTSLSIMKWGSISLSDYFVDYYNTYLSSGSANVPYTRVRNKLQFDGGTNYLLDAIFSFNNNLNLYDEVTTTYGISNQNYLSVKYTDIPTVNSTSVQEKFFLYPLETWGVKTTGGTNRQIGLLYVESAETSASPINSFIFGNKGIGGVVNVDDNNLILDFDNVYLYKNNENSIINKLDIDTLLSTNELNANCLFTPNFTGSNEQSSLSGQPGKGIYGYSRDASTDTVTLTINTTSLIDGLTEELYKTLNVSLTVYQIVGTTLHTVDVSSFDNIPIEITVDNLPYGESVTVNIKNLFTGLKSPWNYRCYLTVYQNGWKRQTTNRLTFNIDGFTDAPSFDYTVFIGSIIRDVKFTGGNENTFPTPVTNGDTTYTWFTNADANQNWYFSKCGTGSNGLPALQYYRYVAKWDKYEVHSGTSVTTKEILNTSSQPIVVNGITYDGLLMQYLGANTVYNDPYIHQYDPSTGTVNNLTNVYDVQGVGICGYSPSVGGVSIEYYWGSNADSGYNPESTITPINDVVMGAGAYTIPLYFYYSQNFETSTGIVKKYSLTGDGNWTETKPTSTQNMRYVTVEGAGGPSGSPYMTKDGVNYGTEPIYYFRLYGLSGSIDFEYPSDGEGSNKYTPHLTGSLGLTIPDWDNRTFKIVSNPYNVQGIVLPSTFDNFAIFSKTIRSANFGVIIADTRFSQLAEITSMSSTTGEEFVEKPQISYINIVLTDNGGNGFYPVRKGSDGTTIVYNISLTGDERQVVNGDIITNATINSTYIGNGNYNGTDALIHKATIDGKTFPDYNAVTSISQNYDAGVVKNMSTNESMSGGQLIVFDKIKVWHRFNFD